jgi:hypothetical protein
MLYRAQAPPMNLTIVTTDVPKVRALIKRHEGHRHPVFRYPESNQIQVTFPFGFDHDNLVVLRQLMTEITNIDNTRVTIER